MVNQEHARAIWQNKREQDMRLMFYHKFQPFSNSQGEVPLLKMTNPGTTQVCLQRSRGGRDGCSGGAGGCRFFCWLMNA